jgi:hypothetical protein
MDVVSNVKKGLVARFQRMLYSMFNIENKNMKFFALFMILFF